MKLKLSIPIMMILVLLTGHKVHSQNYNELNSTFRKWVTIMDYYTDNMKDCTDLDKLSVYCTELADSVTFYSPGLNALREKFEDIDPANPPDEVKNLFIDLAEATTKFSEMLSGLTLIVNNNPDNEPFQSAFGKLNLAIYNSQR